MATSSHKEDAILTRCSTLSIYKLFNDDLNGKLNAHHHEALRQTPFYFMLSVPKASSLDLDFIEALLQRYDPDSCAFRLGVDVLLPFDAMEFSVTMGLQYYGRPVVENMKDKSEFLSCLAREKKVKLSKITGNEVIENLKDIVLSGDTSETTMTGLKRSFVALVFMSVLFPTSHFHIPTFLQWYLDDIDVIRQYSWGVAVHRFICQSMRLHKEKKTRAVDGCLVGVQAWLFERVPHLGVRIPESFTYRLPAQVPNQELVLLRAENVRLRAKRARLEYLLSLREERTTEVGRDQPGADDPQRSGGTSPVRVVVDSQMQGTDDQPMSRGTSPVYENVESQMEGQQPIGEDDTSGQLQSM